MMKFSHLTTSAVVLGTACALLVGMPRYVSQAHAHDDHVTFSAGEPGNPKQRSRVVEISMREGDGKMAFVPDKLEVRRGEQIRFVLKNDGAVEHEFMLATKAENDKHAEVMAEPALAQTQLGSRGPAFLLSSRRVPGPW